MVLGKTCWVCLGTSYIAARAGLTTYVAIERVEACAFACRSAARTKEAGGPPQGGISFAVFKSNVEAK